MNVIRGLVALIKSLAYPCSIRHANDQPRSFEDSACSLIVKKTEGSMQLDSFPCVKRECGDFPLASGTTE